MWLGPIAPAANILTAHPEIANSSIYAAAVLGDFAGVRRFLASDPASATAKGGPRGWDALTYLCFSKYLQSDAERSDGFVQAAQALLEAGASANAGFYDSSHTPHPEWESVLYGAAGVAHHAPLTRLLLEHGAEPNDAEVPYHSPETYDNAALEVLVESGKVNADSLVVMLVRKHDWHDYDGVAYLLQHGADPNRVTWLRHTAFQHAMLRDNRIAIIELLLDHGADAALPARGTTPMAIAARRGRGDVLDLLQRRGIFIKLQGIERLAATCACGQESEARAIAAEPGMASALETQGAGLLSAFAGNNNVEGVRILLDLGVSPGALFQEGDAYFDVTANSTALHAAAWRASHDVVKLLVARGAPVNAVDAKGRTPLALAVRACVDSYWTNRRSPESVAALLAAGADVRGVRISCGYAEVDALFQGRT